MIHLTGHITRIFSLELRKTAQGGVGSSDKYMRIFFYISLIFVLIFSMLTFQLCKCSFSLFLHRKSLQKELCASILSKIELSGTPFSPDFERPSFLLRAQEKRSKREGPVPRVFHGIVWFLTPHKPVSCFFAAEVDLPLLFR